MMMRTTMLTAALAGILMGGGLLAGCESDGDDDLRYGTRATELQRERLREYRQQETQPTEADDGLPQQPRRDNQSIQGGTTRPGTGAPPNVGGQQDDAEAGQPQPDAGEDGAGQQQPGEEGPALPGMGEDDDEEDPEEDDAEQPDEGQGQDQDQPEFDFE